MEWKKRPILKAVVPPSGVTIGNPKFEWMTVAKEYHFKFAEFLELAPESQAEYIAHFRLTQHIGAVLNKDANDKAERAARKK